MTDVHPFRAACAAMALSALALTACGDVAHQVAIPGADPVMAPGSQPVSPHDDAFFTEVTIAPPVTAPLITAPPTAATNTTVSPTVESTAPDVPSTGATVVPMTVATSSPTAPVERVATVELPQVTGWAAFDLHLMTVLQAGSSAVSATVSRNGEILHEVALGDRTPSGDAVSIGDRFRVASISKVLTAITVLRLVEQGALDLDVPVGSSIAERVGVAPSAGVGDMTVRDLLTHRSGIAQYENLMFRRQVESCVEAAAQALGRDLERAPGTTFRYSNVNFCALGLLVEDVTGRPYEEVVRAELLTPLGIDGMRLAGTFDVGDDEVEHRSDEGRNYMEVLGASGSWVASPTEVATIIDSLDLSTPGWKPLGPESVAEMRTITQDPPPPPLTSEQAATTSSTLVPPAPSSPPSHGYGMGLMIFGPDTFGHTGTLESTHAMTVRQADGLTWAITVSGDHPSSSRDLAGVIAEALRYAGVA